MMGLPMKSKPSYQRKKSRRCSDDLTDREAEVVRLYHLKFMNYRDIGKQLGMPENSVGPILAKARKQMREAAEHHQ